MKLHEPMTTITDYILAVLTLVFAVSLFQVAQFDQQTSVWLWGAGFVASSLAAIFGGTTHGFYPYFGRTMQVGIWKLTVYAIGLSTSFMLAGVIIASISVPLRQWAMMLMVAKTIIYMAWMAKHDDFRYVIYDYVLAMVIALFLQVVSATQWQSPSAFWIISGIVVSFIGAGVQQSGFKLHKHFNHNDLYHVIQMISFYLLYRGGLLLIDH